MGVGSFSSVPLQNHKFYKFVGVRILMAFVNTKIIHGKRRKYLETSIRLPTKIKKLSVYMKDDNRELCEKQLKAKVTAAFIDSAGTYFASDRIFTKKTIEKMEFMKLGYKELLKKLTTKQYQDIIDRFAVNFTYESNAIEGNSLTLKDVTMLFHEKTIPRGVNLRDIHETVNTRKALEALFYHKIRIKEKDILHLHETLVKDTGVSLGYKKFPNYLLGRNVQTTAPEYVPSEMKDLLAWYHEHPKMHPLQKAALFHARFEKIHPFEDGNGRVGRILLNAILLLHGYPPLIIRKTQRIAYFGALAAADKGHYDKLSRFLIEKYKKTYQHFFEVYVKYL